MTPLILVMENWKSDYRDLMISLKPDGFDMHFWSGDQDELAEKLAVASYIMVEASPLPGSMIRSAPNLKMIQKYGAGTERIDVATARDLGIPVYYTPGANAVSTAEMAVTLILAVFRHLYEFGAGLREGRWAAIKVQARTGTHELHGKTVGLIGCGDIGGHTARMLSHGFACNVLYHTRHRLPTQVEDELRVSYSSLDDLLRQSDVVSLHLPLTPETRGFVGRRELSLMKPSAILVNTCRGAVVDEAALVEALRSGTIAAAGLDVLEQEPPSLDNPLLKMDNAIVMPHSGGNTLEAATRVTQRAFADIERFEKGEPLPERDRVK